jgi:hypothetical protein
MTPMTIYTATTRPSEVPRLLMRARPARRRRKNR